MQDWLHFSDPDFVLGFQYPPVTAQGHIVEKADDEQDEAIRVHFKSKDSHELYVEITKFVNLSAGAEYQQHKENLEKRPDGFVVSELKEINWMSQQAYEYSLKWSQGARIVRLVEAGMDTYRILYDPKSPLNAQILLTIQWKY